MSELNREHATEENSAMIKGSREMRLPFLFMGIYYFWLDSLPFRPR